MFPPSLHLACVCLSMEVHVCGDKPHKVVPAYAVALRRKVKEARCVDIVRRLSPLSSISKGILPCFVGRRILVAAKTHAGQGMVFHRRGLMPVINLCAGCPELLTSLLLHCAWSQAIICSYCLVFSTSSPPTNTTYYATCRKIITMKLQALPPPAPPPIANIYVANPQESKRELSVKIFTRNMPWPCPT